MRGRNHRHPYIRKWSKPNFMSVTLYHSVSTQLTSFSQDLKNESAQCINAFLQVPKVCRSLTSLRGDHDELFVGRAGYLCASLTLNRALGTVVIPPEVTLPLFDTIVQSGQEYSRQHRSPSPLMYSYYDTEYLGEQHQCCYNKTTMTRSSLQVFTLEVLEVIF